MNTDDQKTKMVVLLSGGQDSTTALYWAKSRGYEVHALSFRYGQRHVVELLAATLIGKLAEVASHKVVELPHLEGSALTGDAPITATGGIADVKAPDGLPTSFVPGRNMVFLAHACAYAATIGAMGVITGVCQTDYSGYPDCRDEFILAMEKAARLALPSSVNVRIVTPLMFLSKEETVAMGVALPGCMEALALSVTCYEGKVPGCRLCPSCVLRAKGFDACGVVDPQFTRGLVTHPDQTVFTSHDALVESELRRLTMTVANTDDIPTIRIPRATRETDDDMIRALADLNIDAGASMYLPEGDE